MRTRQCLQMAVCALFIFPLVDRMIALGQGVVPPGVGPNLVANPSFEDTFTNGVSNQWQSWSTNGAGYWKQSARLGRIGSGMYNGVVGFTETVRMNPKIVVVSDLALGHAPAVRAALPDAIIIGRLYIDHLTDLYVSDPEYYGREFADDCYQASLDKPGIDVWHGMCEQFNSDNLDRATRVARFEKAFAERCHERGLKAIVMNIAVGNPGDKSYMLLPEVVDCLAVADYVGYHSYGSSTYQFMMDPPGVPALQHDYAFRWQGYKDTYDQYGYRMPPVIYTECGTFIAFGKQPEITPEQVRDDYLAFELATKPDVWNTGMVTFVVGAITPWEPRDIRPYPVIYEAIGDHNWGHPADAWEGVHSQQFGETSGGFTGGVVQAVSVAPGTEYRLDHWMKFETYGPDTDVSYQVGYDLTGQTSNADAGSMVWTSDLMAAESRETDWWYDHALTFIPSGSQVSIWFRGSQSSGADTWRVMVDDVSVQEVGSVVDPFISLSTAALSPNCTEGADAISETFTVANGGVGTLNYTISDDVSWLTVTPASGSSTGEADTITVNYSTASLAVGTYNATVTVSDPNASNDSQTIGVTLTVDAAGGGGEPGPNLLTNSNFEGGFYNDPDVDHQSGNGWSRFSLAGVSKAGGYYGLYTSANWSQYINESSWTAGVYQQVSVTSGDMLEGAVNVRGSNYYVKFHVGIDPTGGTDAASGNVIWSDEASPGDSWAWISVQATASASTATLFLKAQNTSPTNRYAWFDDAELRSLGGGGTPLPPEIAVSTPSLTTSITEGNNAADQTFTVSNSGGETLNYTVSDDVTWLSVSPTSGSSTDEADTITVTYSTSALATGTHNATITVSDPNASNNPQTVAVTLTVNATGGGGSNIAEDFESMPSWSSSYDASWGGSASWSIVAGGQSGNALQASRSSGGSSGKVKVYSIDANIDYTISVYIKCPNFGSSYWAECAYRLGSYTAQDFDANSGSWSMIQKFSSSGTNGNGNTWVEYSDTFNSGSDTEISVGFKLGASGAGPTVLWDTLRVTGDGGTPTPAIALSTSSLSASADEGSNATDQTFTVANSGDGTLTYSVNDDASWLNVSPASGTSTGEADSITVTYSTALLTAGTYSATITVSDPNASNNPADITVTLTINPTGGGEFTFPGFTYAQLLDHFQYYHERSECIYEGGGTWAALETNLSHPLMRDSSRRALGYMRASQVESDPVYEDRAQTALNYLVTQQNADGHFTWWNTPLGTDNGFDCQYVTGTAASALAEGYEHYAVASYLQASAAAAQWELTTELVWNTNYIAFGVWHLAKHYGITGEQQWLDAAVYKFEYGLLPRQDTDGGWSEGTGVPADLIGHNKRIWYHGIILRGLIELYRVLPAGHAIETSLADSIQAGVNRALSMQMASGEIAVGSGVPNEHRNAFILKALLMAYEHVGIDTRDAIRGIMQYRMDFTQEPYQVVGFNIDVESIGYLMNHYSAIVPDPPAEPPPPPVPPVAAISNPGFEDDGGFFNLAQDWQTFGYGKREGFQEAGHGWVQGLADYPEDRSMGVYQFVGGVQVGETYRFSVQTRVTSSDLAGSVGVAGVETHDCHLATFSSEHNGTSWATVSVEVTAAEPWMTLFLKGRNTNQYAISFERVLMDNVTIEQVSGAPSPAIELSTTSLDPAATEGSSPSDDVFTVANSGGGTLNYSIIDDASWLSVTPSSGSSAGEADNITVSYATTSLSVGTYNATITVSDPNATNNPQTIAVTLTVNASGGGATSVAEDFDSMPSWTSAYDAGWGSSATWSIASGGQSGSALQASRSSGGSSSKVKVYSIDANTDYTIAVYIKCPNFGSSYWAECAYRLGSHSAQDFDANSGAWSMVKKFSTSTTNGNGNTWTQYSLNFNSGSDTQISVGFKLGSSGGAGPTVQWDTLRIE